MSDTQETAVVAASNPPLTSFARRASVFQTLMVIGDTLQGSYTSLYAVGRGATGLTQGAIVSVRELGTALLQPVWGYLSDLRGRRQFIIVGMLIQALCWGILMPAARDANQVLLILVFQTLFGYMVIPAWNGWLGDFTTRSTRGKFLGRLGIIATWIAAIMLFVVSLYMQFLDPNRDSVDTFSIAFKVAAVFFVLCAIFATFIPQAERYGKQARMAINRSAIPEEKPATFAFVAEMSRLTPDFKRFLLVDGLFRLAWSAAWPVFPYAVLSATQGWLELALLQMVIAIASGLSQLLGGRISDKFGRKIVIITSRSILVMPPVLYGIGVLVQNPTYLLVSNILTGIMFGASLISVNSLILDLAPIGKEGTYFSIYLLVGGIMAFTGSIVTGLVLNIIVPDVAPSDELVATMLFVIAVIRFLAWTAYFFLPDQ